MKLCLFAARFRLIQSSFTIIGYISIYTFWKSHRYGQFIENVITETKSRLLVLDPLSAYIGRDTDIYRVVDMRHLMGRLFVIAERTKCAVLTIGHMNKLTGIKNLKRGLSSIDITASARSVLLVSRLDTDSEIRILSQIKSSLALVRKSDGWYWELPKEDR